MNERAGQYLSTRRVRDRSAILLLIGLALLISPIAGIFEIDAKLGGIPVTLIYTSEITLIVCRVHKWLLQNSLF